MEQAIVQSGFIPPTLLSPFLVMIPLLPLLGAAVIGLFGRHLPRWAAGTLACLSVLGSFVYSLRAVVALARAHGDEILVQEVWTWIDSSDFNIGFDLMVDSLTGVMLLIVTGVGFLIHVYSIGYMAHDEESNRYFSHLNLFICFMLLLVMAKNLVLLFVGWEGVGACSYLLIGYYFREEEKALAGKKAFIVNRVGDMCFVLGLMILAQRMLASGVISLDFLDLREHAAALAAAPPVWIPLVDIRVGVVPMICLLLFIGATGKSAQIPLYVWLPDAMAGPTPVSALIHAATMVTAGVYMICRLSFLFAASGWVMTLVTYTGAFTALMAAVIALRQRDIKKILAYSTISQLGYMFMACGLQAFSFAVFHLFTHAFFKALLFLGAGSVIHALHGEQDIFRMGALKRRLPITYWTFLIGALALSGIPPFAGFFSKDHILWASYQSPHNGNGFVFVVGLATAGLTAFYMFRLISLVFWGESRWNLSRRDRKAIHEAPDTMALPLIVLAFFSMFAGFINLPDALIPGYFPQAADIFSHMLQPVFQESEAHLDHAPILEVIFMAATLLLAIISIQVARSFYTGSHWKAQVSEWEAFWHRRLLDMIDHKFYVDEIYDRIVVRPLLALSRFFKETVDERTIDGILVHGSADLARSLSRGLTAYQNGDVQRYLITVGVGVIVAVVSLTWRLG